MHFSNKWTGDLEESKSTSILVSHDDSAIHKKTIELLQGASDTVHLASSTFRDFKLYAQHGLLSLSEYLLGLRRKCIQVRILTTPRMLSSQFVRNLLSHGSREIQAKTCARTHLKLICVDNRIVYFGTANLTSSGLGLRSSKRRNFEVGMISSDKACVGFIMEIFDRIWNGVYCNSCRYASRADVNCSIPRHIPAGRTIPF